MSQPTTPAAMAPRPGRPSWRYRMWAVCLLAILGSMVMLGMDIGHVPISPALGAWSRVIFCLSVLCPAAEWIIGHHLAVHDARVDDLATQLATITNHGARRDQQIEQLGTDLADIRRRLEATTETINDAINKAYWRGSADQAIADTTGTPVIHLPRNNNRADGRV